MSPNPTTVICAICNDGGDRRPVIDAMLQSGTSFNAIETKMRALGSPTKRETVKKHLVRCLGGDPTRGLHPLDDTHTSRADFALAVRDEANKMLAAGKLKIQTKDGLTAQGLLDRRAEKAQDRTLLMNMARLLSGAGRDVPEDIVGEVVVLTDDGERVPLRLTGT